MRIALVSCVKNKRSSATRAGDLYISALFRAWRDYAIRNADSWYILSAQYGLLHPDEFVEPYERTLRKLKKPERVAWARRVQGQLSTALPATADVIFLAGAQYREELVPFLRKHGYAVSIPFEGLGSGRQLQRLNQLAQASR